jgi:hypothetical protein
MFDPLNFDDLNEADVREEVLAPLISFLGYRSGTQHNVIREQSLRYPKISLGRKNEKKDPPLRGKADYILSAENKVRWVIEAKSASVDIGDDEVEQAYSYANHSEVRAVYFALSNGRVFLVFQTNQGPAAAPILSLQYENFNANHHTLRDLLSPASLLRDHPEIKPDLGIPLGMGLRSLARIASGRITYATPDPTLKGLNATHIVISGGAIQRDESGKLIAYVETVTSITSVQELLQKLGLQNYEVECADSALSSDPRKPSIFRYRGMFVFPKGERMLDLNTWQLNTLPWDVPASVDWEGTGTLNGKVFSGTVVSRIAITVPGKTVTVPLQGNFELTLV